MDTQSQAGSVIGTVRRRRRQVPSIALLDCVTTKEMKAALVRFYGETGDSGSTDVSPVGGDPSAAR
jgi:hypothetical protein